MTDADRVETLERQIVLHAETRGDVAECIAEPFADTAAAVPVEAPVVVEEESVELFRAMPTAPVNAPEPEPVEDVAPVAVEPVVEEPDEPELCAPYEPVSEDHLLMALLRG